MEENKSFSFSETASLYFSTDASGTLQGSPVPIYVAALYKDQALDCNLGELSSVPVSGFAGCKSYQLFSQWVHLHKTPTAQMLLHGHLVLA